ncbi:secondary thiamine-phosphate synthase enzyme YjbQ [uncultured Abyssibacter sp.]|uniref:secondary thiamine-phosphate synthase enzyme YjbQ n=1 Tax=uncultured Abyssibacter sp. TaxID=2320202 RepID=UPI0032B29D2B
MSAAATEFSISTNPGALTEFTDDVARWVTAQGIRTGQCALWLRHTSAGLIVCENADPDVQHDLRTYLWDLAPDGDPRYIHTAEGPDDMSAHVRSVLTGCQLTIPVMDGRLQLGTWQGLFVWEFRAQSHRRRVSVSLVGD